jgi:hypothetical protein
MFEIDILDKPDVIKLLVGSNVFTGYNVRLDIFTPIEPHELSTIIDLEFDKAEKKANVAALDPELNRKYENMSRFNSAWAIPPLTPKNEYLEGQNGPPLGKALSFGTPQKKIDQVWIHKIIQTYGARDYSEPRDGYAYSMVRKYLSSEQGNFWIFDAKSPQNIINNSFHDRFNFEAMSDMCLPQFVLGMINLFGNYSKEALNAKMSYVQPSVEEGMAQREAIRKLSRFFDRLNFPFYATMHNSNNNHSELIYGVNSGGKIIKQLTSNS